MSGGENRLRHTTRRHAQALCEQLLPMVDRAAARNADRGMSEGDLFQEGALALMALCVAEVESVHGRRLNAAEEATFAARAEKEVEAGMVEAIRDAEAARANDRRIVRDLQKFEVAELQVASDLKRQATDIELAAHLRWEIARVVEIRAIRDEARNAADLELLPFLEEEDLDIAMATLIELDQKMAEDSGQLN